MRPFRPVLHGGLAPGGLDREKINEPLHHMPESRVAPYSQATLPRHQVQALCCDGPPLDHQAGNYRLMVWTPVPKKIASAQTFSC